MATTSFSKLKEVNTIETPAIVEATATVVEATATVEPKPIPAPEALITPTQTSSIPNGMQGEFESSDIRLPRLNLIQKMSDMVNSGFRPGDILYNKELALNKPAEVVVVKVKKQYQQDLPYGGDVLPHVCDTLAEVREAGGTTEWGGENHYSEMAHLQLLVKAPDNLHAEYEDLFPYEVDGTSWAPAMFTVAKTAYKSAAKPVITAAFSTLRSGLGNGLWHLSGELKSNAMGSWFVPVMKLAGKTSPNLAELVASINQD